MYAPTVSVYPVWCIVLSLCGCVHVAVALTILNLLSDSVATYWSFSC